MMLFIIFSLFFLIFYKEKEFILVSGMLFFVSGVIFYGIIHYEKSFRHISGIVTLTQYDNSGDSRRQNPSLIIFLESHLEPLKFTAEKEKVREMNRRLKKGDKVDIVVESFFDNIWGITVGNDDILSFSQEKKEKNDYASFLILYGAFLYVVIVFGKHIVAKIRSFKTRRYHKKLN
ncbi:hypothetical protein [Desulfoluna sp.]|uniref:hypothetical protein n=1 Tax=Desulfoluna sp. TaxID=2045199 RepID=UPI0026242519|nr:hypothetical protein [Desulfoluna sp.]